MKHYQLLIARFFGAIVGCVATESVRLATVQAQAAPGPSGFRECANYAIREWDSDLEDLPGIARPIGEWTPVGAWANGVVVCR